MINKILQTTLLTCLLMGYQLVSGQANFGSSETIVNTTTSNNQIRPAIAMNSSGEYVVVWASEDQDGSDYGIYFQYYDSSGTATGSETLVNSGADDTNGGQRNPAVTLDNNGAFAIVWMSDGTDGDGLSCYYKRYTNSTTAQTSEIRANSSSTGDQKHPDIAGDTAGNYVIVYESEPQDGDGFGIYHRRYSAGITLSSGTLTNDSTADNQILPKIAMSSTGGYVIVWQSEGTDGSGAGIYGKLYDSSGNAVTSQFQVNTTTSGNQQQPDVAMAADGSFVVVWASYDQDGNDYGIYGQRYNASGVAQGSEFLINTTTTGTQNHPTITSNVEGGFVVLWDSYGQDGSYDGVYYQVYRNGGTTDGTEGRVNIRTSDFQQFPAAAWYAEEMNLKVAWQSGLYNSTSTQDTDGYGIVLNSATMADTTPPTAVCQNVTIYLDGTGNATLTAADVDGGSSDNVGIETFVVNTTTFACGDIGSSSVILTVTDSAGNSSACGASVTISDSISPTAVCNDLTVYVDGSGNATITTGDVDGGSSDNCTVSSFALSTSSFDCNAVGSNSEVLTVTDQSGNTSTCTANITVLDSVSPTAVCQDLTVYLDGAGSATITGGDVDNGSSDNCSNFTPSLTVSGFGCTEIGANTTTLIITDPGGNVDSCSATVTVIDSVSPTMVCSDISIFLDGSGAAALTAADLDGGSSDNCSTLSLSITDSSFTCADIGTASVVLTGTDANGNTANCTSTVTITDTVSPTMVCQDITIQLDGSGAASITASDVDGGSTDNCSLTSTSIDISSFNCSNVGSNNVVLTGVDSSGNSATCTAVVTVEDTIAPTAVCQDLTVHLSSTGSASITTGDVDNGSSDNCTLSNLNLDNTTFACADVGANTVTLTVTDAGGNTASCTANIQVVDSVSPVATCQDVTLQLDGSGNATLSTGDVDNGSSDACGVNSLSLNTTAFACVDTGSTVVTLTVDDVNGNSSTCTSNVTIEDVTAPTMVCQDITVQLDGSGGATLATTDIDNGSADNCGINSLSLDITSFGCTETGANTVTLSGSDVSANTSTCTAIVTVEDNIAPTALCQDLTLYLDGNGSAATTGPVVSNGSSDNCSILSETLDVSSFSCADVGSNTVTLTVTDASSNATTCTAAIEVIDSLLPTAVCQDVTLQLDATGTATLTTTDVDNGSSDNCGINSLSLNLSSFSCGDIGTANVTMTLVDDNGNSNNCTVSVTIEDVLPPVMVCQNVTVQLDASGNGTLATADVDGGTSDNCSLSSTSIDVTAFTCSDVGSNTVVLTANDVNGNMNTCNSTVVVEDNIAPAALCQNVTVYLDANGAASIGTTDIDGGSTDACGIANQALNNTAFACGDVGSNAVTLTITDVNNNSSTCAASVEVLDTIAPGAICQNISVFLDGNGQASLAGSDIDGGSTDNCSVTSLTSNLTTFGCMDVGSNSATLTASDPSGNATTCIASVIVVDSVSPVPSCNDVTVQLDNNGLATINVATVSSGSTDNCSVLSESLSATAFNCTDVGANNITLSVTDVNNNGASCVSVVTIVDQIVPSPVCQSLTLYLDGNGSASITTADIDNGSTDNCVLASLALSQSTFGCSDLGNNTISMIATDASGNQAICNAFVNVLDTIAPVAQCTDLTLFLDGNGNATITTNDVGNGSSDNCSITNTTLTQTSFDCQDVGSNGVTLSLDDASGNSVSCSATITVEDSTSPTMICNSINVVLDNAGSGSITTASLDGGSFDNCGINSLQISQSNFDCSDRGVNLITLDAVDVNGNAASCTSQVNVLDQDDPVAVCLSPTIYLDANGSALLLASDVDGGSTDNCGIANSILTVSSFDCTDIGSNFVGLTVVDSSNNSTTCATNVLVLDSLAPVASCQDISVQLDANGQFILTASQIDNGSTDNCAINSSSISQDTFGCADVGSNAIVLSLDDASGNLDSCTANVFITDSVSPVALCQAATVTLDANGAASITTADVDGGSSDNCSINTLSLNQTTFGCSDVGTVTVTLSVTDLFGNATTCIANVTVLDTVNPIALCLASVDVYLDVNGTASLTVADVDQGSSDNCSISSSNLSQSAFTCADLGTNAINLVVQDVNGNTDSCAISTTVLDTLNPNALCQNLTTVLDSNGFVAINPIDIGGSSSDNCSIASLTTSIDSLSCGDVGINGITLFVTDASNNLDSCFATITVSDQAVPVANCDDITAYLDGSGNLTVTEADVASNSFDNCGLTFNLTNNVFDCSDLGVNTVIVTMTDPSNNNNSCFSQVTVEDSTAPSVQCQDITVAISGGSVIVSFADITVGVPTDNCGIQSPTVSNNVLDCSNLGLNVVVANVPDINGNVGTCQSIVTLVDPVPPMAVCQAVVLELDSNGVIAVDPNALNNGSVDNCGVDSLSTSIDTLDCGDVGDQPVTLFVYDGSQNVDSCSAIVTVQDNLLPVALCAPDTIGVDTGQVVILPAANVDGGSSDNCGIDSLGVSPNSFNIADLGLNNVVLTVVDNNGNASTCSTTVFVEQMVGIEDGVDLQASLQFDAYPNPTQGILQIDVGCIDCVFRENARLTLVDLRGKVLVDRELKKNRTTHSLEIDMTNYALGTYLLRLETERGEAVQHIVKY